MDSTSLLTDIILVKSQSFQLILVQSLSTGKVYILSFGSPSNVLM
jgi:hypothetical protein